MGFFSFNCKGCKTSVREGELVFKMGEYDGYGRVDDDEGMDAQYWHVACLSKLAGKDLAAMGSSSSARDQGCGPVREEFLPRRGQ